MNNGVKVGTHKFTYKKNFGKDKEWFIQFKKMFKISNIEKSIKCDGIKVLPLLLNLGKIKDKNLRYFIEEGYLSKFSSSKNKKAFLVQFSKVLKRTNNKIRKVRSFEVLRRLKIDTGYISNKISRSPKNIRSRSICGSSIHALPKEPFLNYGKKLWVTIGIDNYKNWPKLRNAKSDSIKIANFIKDFNYETINIVDSEATKDKIEKIFKHNLYYNLCENDLLVFSFHGHGTNIYIGEREHGFIVPYEASNTPSPYELISIEEFTGWIKFLKCRNVLLIFDSCFSGFAVLRGAKPKIQNNAKEDSILEAETTKKFRRFSDSTIQKLISKKNRIAITAGTNDEMVSDGGWENNSAFTGLILSYPGFKTGICSVLELYSYLLINVPKYSNQTPCIGKLIGDEGGDIFLTL